MSEQARQTLLIAATVLMLSLGVGLAVADSTYAGSTAKHCLSWPPLQLGCPTTTVTVTQTAPNIAPFYTAYLQNGTVGYCWTYDQVVSALASGVPETDCHGVRNP